METDSEFEHVLRLAEELLAALERLSKSNQGAKHLAVLVGKDTDRLRAALVAGDVDRALTALLFPSLDGRAADYTGGFDMESHPDTAPHYFALNAAIRDIFRKQ